MNQRNNQQRPVTEVEAIESGKRPGDLYEILIRELPRIGEAVRRLPPSLAEVAYKSLVEILCDQYEHGVHDDPVNDGDPVSVQHVSMDVPEHWNQPMAGAVHVDRRGGSVEDDE